MRSLVLCLLDYVLPTLVCDYDEKCDTICMSDVCEYRWNIDYTSSMRWRTRGKDFPLTWNNAQNGI